MEADKEDVSEKEEEKGKQSASGIGGRWWRMECVFGKCGIYVSESIGHKQYNSNSVGDVYWEWAWARGYRRDEVKIKFNR